ncbi:conserved Plasmodium protein, unknown function [Plasmodium vinckei brucechwatti]|uniref:Uncharacterized protein n=1 Tax=Plasmodium vinckei brucechwatti TaxID=119398 RepID=A0A6V7T1L2_PLAVN|nr:conserved Plasmodium protein, unknown function [Plasmodium vinckei brucechwatti]
MKITKVLESILVCGCEKKIPKELLISVKDILKHNDKRKKDEIKELFEYISNILNKGFEKDGILKEGINSLDSEKKKKIIFNNLKKIFKTLILFKNQNEYTELLSDFLFHLYKYMRILNVKKCYKLLKKTVSILDGDGKRESNSAQDQDKDEKEKEIKTETSASDMIFNFLINSNILIYLERLKKENKQNLCYDEHYFFINLKNKILNKKYILTLCNNNNVLLCFLKYPKFPIFIDTLFNLFFFVRNDLDIFFIRNIFKKISEIVNIKNNEMHRKFTIKKYYNLLFYAYFLYKIKMVIYLYLYPLKCNSILNDKIEAQTIIDIYTNILSDYKNILYYCISTINNSKKNKLYNFCLAIIYIINLIYTNNNTILKVFPQNNDNIIAFKKYRDIFLQYKKIFQKLSHHCKDNIATEGKIRTIVCSIKMFAKENNINNYNKKKNGISEQCAMLNMCVNTTTGKKEIYKFLYNEITETDYCYTTVFSYFYTLTKRIIQIYDFPNILTDIIFYKKFFINNLYEEIRTNKTNFHQADYSKIIYNNVFLDNVKNGLCLFINIDKNILNYYFLNEFYKFLINKCVNYRSLYNMLIYDTKNKYNKINIFLFFQKIILRNVLNHVLLIENEKAHDQTLQINSSGKPNELSNDFKINKNNIPLQRHTNNTIGLIYFFKKENDKLLGLKINEFNINSKDINNIASLKTENLFIILKNIDFINLNNNNTNFIFDKNIINILIHQLTKESLSLFNYLHTTNLKEKKTEETKEMIYHQINKLKKQIIIIFKSMYNFSNSMVSIFNLTKSGKKCVLCINEKKQYILTTENYYDKIKHKNKKDEQKEIVYLSFRQEWGGKRKNFKLLKNCIKLYVNFIEKTFKNHNEKEVIILYELGTAILFAFNFLIFYIMNNITIQNVNNKNMSKTKIYRFKKIYNNIFTELNNINKIINKKTDKNEEQCLTTSTELQTILTVFSKYYYFINKKLNTQFEKNYLSLFINYNYLQKKNGKKNKQALHISKKIFKQLKNTSVNEILFNANNLDYSESEVEEIQNEQDKNINLPISLEMENASEKGEEDIVVSSSALLNILTDNPTKEQKENNETDENYENENKMSVTRKKEHTNIFHNINALLTLFKINTKTQNVEAAIKSLYLLLRSSILISKRIRVASKRVNALKRVEEQKEVEEQEEVEEQKEVEEQEEVEEQDEGEEQEEVEEQDEGEEENEVEEQDEGEEENEVEEQDESESEKASKMKMKKAGNMYIEDMLNLEKKIKHCIISFKVNNKLDMEVNDNVEGLIEKYVLKILRILIKNGKSNMDTINLCLKCLDFYNNMENKIFKKKQNIVINYLYEFVQIIMFIKKARAYYLKFLISFFKSSFIKYINGNEMFSKQYGGKSIFPVLMDKFTSDFYIYNYINNEKKINIMNRKGKENISKMLFENMIEKIGKRKQNENVEQNNIENYDNYVNYIIVREENNKSILSPFNLDELKNIVHNIFIQLNYVLNQNNPYLFNKKRNITLIFLLKKISQIIFINDPNILLFKNQLISKHMNQIFIFKNKLDEKINTQQICININNFYKKLEDLIKFIQVKDINMSLNNSNHSTKHKRPIHDDMYKAKKIKI